MRRLKMKRCRHRNLCNGAPNLDGVPILDYHTRIQTPPLPPTPQLSLMSQLHQLKLHQLHIRRMAVYMTLQVPIMHHYYVRRALILFSHLDIAVVLSNSLPSPPEDDIFSAPPPEEDAQFAYPEKDEDMTEEEYHSRLTILGIHQLARRAALPLDTFILAALILKQLQTVSEEFYDDWLYELRKARVREYDRCKEVVVLSAIVPYPYLPN